MKELRTWVIILLIMNAVCIGVLLFINHDKEIQREEIQMGLDEVIYERNVLSDIIRNKLDCEAVGDKTSMEKLCNDYLDNWGNTGDWKVILSNWSYSYPTGPVE